MPAFIDMHAHFRHPGQSRKETLETGLRAAVAGGYGAVVLMPNTSPPVDDEQTARAVEAEAAALNIPASPRVIQSVSVTRGQKGESVCAIREFERVKIISEDGRDVDDAALMLDALMLSARKNIIAACHCEDARLSERARARRAAALKILRDAGISLLSASASHQPALSEAASELRKANELLALAEETATERNIALAEKAGSSCRLHICHVSTARALDSIARAKQRNLCAVSCEVTPHHIALSSEEGAGIFQLVNPPLRAQSDRAALLDAAASGIVDVIATDHAPHALQDKENGASGFPGLETAFAVCNTALVESGIIPLQKLSALMSANPARLLGLQTGRLREGFPADMVLADPRETWRVDGARFFTKGACSPFDGMRLTGKIKAVYKEGAGVFF
jgi:dihydroorotase